jgi:hypothetical protein
MATAQRVRVPLVSINTSRRSLGSLAVADGGVQVVTYACQRAHACAGVVLLCLAVAPRTCVAVLHYAACSTPVPRQQYLV